MNARYGQAVSRPRSKVHASDFGRPLCGKRSVRGIRWKNALNKVTCKRCSKLAAELVEPVLKFRQPAECTNANVKRSP